VKKSELKKSEFNPDNLTHDQLKARAEQVFAEAAHWSMAAARLKHGFYSKQNPEAIRALGEDPADFEALQESLTETWSPETVYEHLLVRRLARAYWQLERADAFREGVTVSRAELVNRALERLAEAEDSGGKQIISVLRETLAAAEASDVFATSTLVEGLHQMFGSKPAARRREILYRTFRLLPPQAGAAPELPPPASPALLAAGDRLEPAQGEERIRLREELCLMLREEVESLTVAQQEGQKRRAQELSSSFRDACMAPTNSGSAFMLRMENVYFGQVDRLTQLLMKVQKARKKMTQNEGSYPDLAENKGSVPFSPRQLSRYR
jgi:hypothetical protein